MTDERVPTDDLITHSMWGARRAVAALIRYGVRDVVLCPGSRSAPLAFALADAEAAGLLRVHVRVDERSAGFIALGMSRVHTSAVVTTSGTAVANLHPAVLEAAHSRVPLLVISADRPHALRGVGANQTTDQVGIFGSAVVFSRDVPAGDDPSDPIRRAIAAANGGPGGRGGPVQVNLSFADPLPPSDQWRLDLEMVDAWGEGSESEVVMTAGRRALTIDRDRVVVKEWTDPRWSVALDPDSRGVIIAADAADAYDHRHHWPSWVEGAQWPILAEPTSAMRRHERSIADYHSRLAVLADQIETVVVVGRPTLSRDVSALLARRDLHVVVVAQDQPWPDVAGTAKAVATQIDWEEGVSPPGWLAQWRTEPSSAAGSEGEREFEPGTTQLDFAAVVTAVLTRPEPVLLGSSLTIREADRHGPTGPGLVSDFVCANRGLAGIDGLIATGSGLALALDTGVRVLLGDVSFAHDAMSLVQPDRERQPDLQVVIADNGGGRIFRTLEYGAPEFAPYVSRFFDTPQRIDVERLAAALGVEYRRVNDPLELAEAMTRPILGRQLVHAVLEDGA